MTKIRGNLVSIDGEHLLQFFEQKYNLPHPRKAPPPSTDPPAPSTDAPPPVSDPPPPISEAAPSHTDSPLSQSKIENPESQIDNPSQSKIENPESKIDHPLPLHLFTLDSIPDTPLRWLWPGKIPVGLVTLLTGDTGVNKSYFAADLAARVTRGRPLPPEARRRRPADVLYLAGDDLAALTLRPRMRDAGANLARVHVLPAVRRRADHGRRLPPVSLHHELDQIAAEVRARPDVRLIVIDPINAYLHGVRENQHADVRALFAELEDLAREADAALLVVVQPPCVPHGRALARHAVSALLASVARVALAIVDDHQVARRRLLLPVKVGPVLDETGRAFTVEHGRIVWDPETVYLTAPQLHTLTRAELAVTDLLPDAVGWLRALLRMGRVRTPEVYRLAARRRIPQRLLLRARRELGVRDVHDGRSARWFWELPNPLLDPSPDDSLWP